MIANQHDVEIIEKLYDGRMAFYGELHDHSESGGTSDGKRPLSHWLGAMEALGMDFAAILDHKQVRHMYLPEWKDGIFVGGTEPGAVLLDGKAQKNALHYNMIFEGPAPLEALLSRFPEYEFEGGAEGHFKYPRFTRARFTELIEAVKESGGFFVHPHPKQVMISDDPLDYWFADDTGIEVFYGSMDSEHTALNYALWCDLLSMGKRIFATAGGDGHACASDAALTTVYAEEKSNKSYISHFRKGDLVCGAVGIRTCIGDMLMGGSCNFDGGRFIVSVGDFHKSVRFADHKYRVDLISDEGLVESHEIGCLDRSYFAVDTKDKKFYRVEVFDETRDLRIAVSNPIWNDK